MATRRETVFLDNSSAPLRRVVFDRITDPKNGLETGFARHRGNDAAVWRPANPRCLGLDRSWRDGRWRNIFETRAKISGGDASHMFVRGPVRIGEVEATLPLARFSPTAALQQFVKQHLR